MRDPFWNRIDVFGWSADFGGDKLTVDTNEWSERPVVIEIPARSRSGDDVSVWMTPGGSAATRRQADRVFRSRRARRARTTGKRASRWKPGGARPR